MKIVKMIRNFYVGARLYSEGVQYEVEDQVAEFLIAEGAAELATA